MWMLKLSVLKWNKIIFDNYYIICHCKLHILLFFYFNSSRVYKVWIVPWKVSKTIPLNLLRGAIKRMCVKMKLPFLSYLCMSNICCHFLNECHVHTKEVTQLIEKICTRVYMIGTIIYNNIFFRLFFDLEF